MISQNLWAGNPDGCHMFALKSANSSRMKSSMEERTAHLTWGMVFVIDASGPSAIHLSQHTRARIFACVQDTEEAWQTCPLSADGFMHYSLLRHFYAVSLPVSLPVSLHCSQTSWLDGRISGNRLSSFPGAGLIWLQPPLDVCESVDCTSDTNADCHAHSYVSFLLHLGKMLCLLF